MSPFGADGIYGVTRGGDSGDYKYVAVGENGKIAYSEDDDDTWTLCTSTPFGNDTIYGVTWGGGKFVAVGSGSKVATSTNGTTWTQVTDDDITDNGYMFLDIAWGNNKFVAISSGGRVFYSSSGTSSSWDMAMTSMGYFSSGVYGVIFGAGKFVAVGANGKMATSLDGATWTPVDTTSFGTDYIYGVTFGNNKFVAVGANGKIATSPNGTTWTQVATSTFNTSSRIDSIAFGGGRFVAIGGQSKEEIGYSSDGITWTQVADGNRPFVYGNIQGVAWGGTSFLMFDWQSDIAYSGIVTP
jgi:hypothetical protein